jgi:hypothetical protein
MYTASEVCFMAQRMKRTQILFPEGEYERLRKEAEARSCSIGQLVRDAVKITYLARPEKKRRDAARRLIAMELPVVDWEQMEEEIAKGRNHE